MTTITKLKNALSAVEGKTATHTFGVSLLQAVIAEMEARMVGVEKPKAEPTQECDSPALCRISGSCAGQYGTKKICSQPKAEPVQCLDCGSNNLGVPANYDSLADSVKTQGQEPEMFACEVKARHLSHPLRDYHVAMSKGPLHYTWTDKPHRLVYDLIAAVKFYAAAPQAKALTRHQIDEAVSDWFADGWAKKAARGMLDDLGIKGGGA